MKTKDNEITTSEDPKGKKMTRKAAITKAGFIAISAATTMMLLKPLKAPAGTGGSGAPVAPTSEPSGSWTKRT